MESEKVKVLLELELKYCERCGGLWLRERGTEAAYCPACLPRMMELPPLRKRRRGARVSLTYLGRIEGELEGRIVVCAEGRQRMTAEGLSVIGAVEGSGERGRRWEWGDDPYLCLYRDRTVALLRRYLRSSVETGKVPSLLGMEFFRSHVTSYHFATFEDVVIFVHDVERCVAKLDQFSRDLIARITLQEYTQEEAARLLGCSRRTVARKYPEALDHLSEFFLEVGLIRPFPPLPEEGGLDCQVGEPKEKLASI